MHEPDKQDGLARNSRIHRESFHADSFASLDSVASLSEEIKSPKQKQLVELKRSVLLQKDMLADIVTFEQKITCMMSERADYSQAMIGDIGVVLAALSAFKNRLRTDLDAVSAGSISPVEYLLGRTIFTESSYRLSVAKFPHHKFQFQDWACPIYRCPMMRFPPSSITITVEPVPHSMATTGLIIKRFPFTGIETAQDIINRAATSFRPAPRDGQQLVLRAKDRTEFLYGPGLLATFESVRNSLRESKSPALLLMWRPCEPSSFIATRADMFTSEQKKYHEKAEKADAGSGSVALLAPTHWEGLELETYFGGERKADDDLTMVISFVRSFFHVFVCIWLLGLLGFLLFLTLIYSRHFLHVYFKESFGDSQSATSSSSSNSAKVESALFGDTSDELPVLAAAHDNRKRTCIIVPSNMGRKKPDIDRGPPVGGQEPFAEALALSVGLRAGSYTRAYQVPGVFLSRWAA
jgi:hypothetical protein